MLTIPSRYPPEVQDAIWQEYHAGRTFRIMRNEMERGIKVYSKPEFAAAAEALRRAIVHRESLKRHYPEKG
jgi:hypothetical protein